MTTFERPSRLTIYLCDSTWHERKPLCDVIVRRARDAGLSGATVTRGIEGFGRAGDVHTRRIVDASEHLPVTVVIIDDAAKLRDFTHHNDDCLHGRLVTLEPIEICASGSR